MLFLEKHEFFLSQIMAEWDKTVTRSLSSLNFVPKLKTLNIKSPPPRLLPILLVLSMLAHPFLIEIFSPDLSD